jgi:hypothetical protein
MTEAPVPIIFNDIKYYYYKDLIKYDKAFFIGCASKKDVIIKKKLNNNDYIYTTIKKGIMVESNEYNTQYKLYINESWCLNNYPKFIKNNSEEEQKKLYKYEQAPPILELEDEEYFKDENNNILKMEVRGERHPDKCYFKVKDISTIFNIINLNKIVSNREGNYIKNKHYNIFSINKGTINGTLNVSGGGRDLKTYLTYCGLLKVLFSSKLTSGSIAHKFQTWATEKLFTFHLGTPEMKEKLSAELLGVNYQTIKNVFSNNNNKTPCVYLFFIGNMNEILKDTKYKKDDMLCKFGYTDDLTRRAYEHNKTYKDEFGVNVELISFSIIDPKFLSDAETNIKSYLKSNLITYKNYNELVMVNKSELKVIKNQYRLIQNSYIGCYSELYDKLNKAEVEILKLNNELKLKDKDIELLNKEIELKNKDNELLKLKLEMMEYKANK